MKLKNPKSLISVLDSSVFQVSETHDIIFYNNIIFDSNNHCTKMATFEYIDSYQSLTCWFIEDKIELDVYKI